MRLNSLACLALAAAPLAACAPAAAQQPVPPQPVPLPSAPAPRGPSVITSGRGETKVAPDRATVTVTVETHGATAAAAAAENARQQTSTISALRAAGLEAKDVSTAGYSVTPEYQYGPNTKPKVTGYAARNTITAEVKRIDQVGKVIDAALAGGANLIGGVQFSASNTDEARRTALAKAVQQACLDAGAMAKAVGASAGEALELSSQLYEAPPRPLMEVGMMQARAAAADVPTPINPGDFTVTATVVARWPLQYGGGTAQDAVARCQ
ncbi:MAG: SIMPL domain-containing protein [Gemmatimonadaceae bacterium]